MLGRHRRRYDADVGNAIAHESLRKSLVSSERPVAACVQCCGEGRKCLCFFGVCELQSVDVSRSVNIRTLNGKHVDKRGSDVSLAEVLDMNFTQV